MHTILQTNTLKVWRITCDPSNGWRITQPILQTSHSKVWRIACNHKVWSVLYNPSKHPMIVCDPSNLRRICLKDRMHNPSTLRRIAWHYLNFRRISLKDHTWNPSTRMQSFKLILWRFEGLRVILQTNPSKAWRNACVPSKGWIIEHNPSIILRH